MINESNSIPDSTYFRTGDVEPTINDDGSITIYNGEGSRRSWGRPGVTSTVVVDAPDFVTIHVGFHHKHGGGQFWRYYAINGETKQVSWTSLDDETRQVVLDAAAEHAPRWAKSPGKLRKDYRSMNPKAHAFTGQKIVRLEEDGTMRGLYDSSVVYEMGRTKIERARPNHGGGYYVYVGVDVEGAYRAGDIFNEPKPGRYAVLECECWGNRVQYGTDGVNKVSATYCKPVEILKTFEIMAS